MDALTETTTSTPTIILSDYLSAYEQFAHDTDLGAKEIRAHAGRATNALVTIGAVLRAVKAVQGHGFFGKWIDQQNALFKSTVGKQGFGVTQNTVDNYMKLSEFQEFHTDDWYTYKDLNVGILYKMARAVDKGIEPAVWLAQYNGSTDGLMLEATNGVTENALADVDTGADLATSWRGLWRMVCDETITVKAARAVVASAESADFRAVNVARQYGVLSVRELDILDRIARSIDLAQRENSPYADVFLEIENTKGFITIAVDDPNDREAGQLEIEKLNYRELWAAYKAGCIAHNDPNPTKTKYINRAIPAAVAREIADLIGDEQAIANLAELDDETVIKLVVQE